MEQMDNPTFDINLIWHLVAALLAFAAIWNAFKRVPFQALWAEPRLQHLLFGAMVLLMLTWTFRAGLSEGLSVHFLGMTALTLMFGWDLAILAGAMAMLGITLVGVERVDMLAINFVAIVVVPATLTITLLRYIEKRYPPNFFAYLFLAAFIGGGFAVASSGLTLSLVLGLSGIHSWQTIYQEYISFLPLIMFPEGLINGILMTAVMVFHPDWIRTFDAAKYIDNQ